MSSFDEHIDVACPLAQAASRLRTFLRSQGSADADVMKLELRLEIAIPGAQPLGLERAVIATIQSAHHPEDMAPRFSVQWAPEVPGPFPLFSGQLLVEGDDDYNSFTLHLTGTYVPPLGAAGRAFDAILGNRIAHATASDLLARIKTFVERDFQADEAGKLQARP